MQVEGCNVHMRARLRILRAQAGTAQDVQRPPSKACRLSADTAARTGWQHRNALISS